MIIVLSIAVLTYGIWGCTGTGTPPVEPVTAESDATAEEPTPTPQSTFESEMAIMDGYEAELADVAGDVAKGGEASYDLVSAFAVATENSVLVRIKSSEPMTISSRTDVRFWIEQGEQLLTVEAKPDHPERICELTPIGGSDGEEVPDCLKLGDTLDVRIPAEQLPSWLKTDQDYFISGVSTCCTDESREVPYDEIDGAQQVWVVPATPSAGAEDADEAQAEPVAAAPAP